MASPNQEDLGYLETPLPPPSPEAGGIVRNAPWWLVSLGLHLVVLLGAALVYVERAFGNEETIYELRFWKQSNSFAEMNPQPIQEPGQGTPSVDDARAPEVDDPVISFPDSELGDHLESANNEDYKKMKGDSQKFLARREGESEGPLGRKALRNAGRADTMGVGGGAGGQGAHGGPYGGRKDIRIGRKIPGVTPDGEVAVKAALQWLARHQNPDGSWSADGFSARCAGSPCSGAGERDYDTGVTGLSLLSFLGAGYSHVSRNQEDDPLSPGRKIRFGEVVKRALQWLIARQDPDGLIGGRGQKYMYNHTLAALALSEAYGMTSSPQLRDPAQKAIDFVVRSQNPGRGWRYSAQSGENDSSVTGWAVMALKSAELSGLHFPHSAYEGALAWMNQATDRSGYYRTGYNAAGAGKVYIPGRNESWDDHPAMSAVAVMSRIFMVRDRKDPALGAVALLAGDLPEWKPGRIDFYYWYYASLALFQYDGPSGGLWKRWNEPMKGAIVPHQHTRASGCRDGSWDPEVDRWGFEGGRVYATAINALTLEVYYRYANVFGVSERN